MKYLFLLIAGLLSFNGSAALSQIIDQRSEITPSLHGGVISDSTADNLNSNTQADSGSIPGFYYEPTDDYAPSLSSMEGTSQSGSIQTEYLDPDGEYNFQRVWKSGATPDAITKVGDLTTNPELKPFFNFSKLTFRRILKDEDPDSTLLKSIGLINNLTLGELLEIFPELQNKVIEDFVILDESFKNIDLALDTNSNSNRILNNAQQLLIEQLASNPAFENIPTEELTEGDWSEVIAQSEQEILQQVLAQYPELELVPVNRLFPIVEGVISGDWQSILQQAQQVAIEQGKQILTSQLLQLVPELIDIPLSALPIDDLVVSDLEGLADLTLEEIPSLENSYLSQVGNLSKQAGSYISELEPDVFTGDLFGKLDIAYAGPTETPITHILSGGTRNQIFKPEPCFELSCKHFEITDIFNPIGLEGELSGKAWVQGTSQQVPGGKGFLIPVNGGKERTGVSVWSPDSHVKLSLENIDEGGNGIPASAQVWLNFQFCVYPPFMGEHCTPHFIPVPTPWKVQEGGLILVFSRDKPSELIKNATSDKQ